MMVRIICFSLVAFIFSCSHFQSDQNATGKDTSNLFNGVWAENEKDNALFIIQGDSVTNIEHGDRMHFKVLADTLIIDYGDDVIGRHLILKHTKDSLILQNEDSSITRLYKR